MFTTLSLFRVQFSTFHEVISVINKNTDDGITLVVSHSPMQTREEVWENEKVCVNPNRRGEGLRKLLSSPKLTPDVNYLTLFLELSQCKVTHSLCKHGKRFLFRL